MLSLTNKALEEFDNQHDFERMCADILNALGYKHVVLMAPRGGGDGGRDVKFRTYDNRSALACVTIRDDSDKKFNEDFSQRSKDEYARYIFFTNQYLSSNQKDKYEKYCSENLNASLDIYDREALRSLLDSALKEERKRYLHIDDDISAVIRKNIAKILKYRATLPQKKFIDQVDFIVWRLTRPLNREIYYLISEIDDDELSQVPFLGEILFRYKENYYNFCLIAQELTNKCKDIIGTQTVTPDQFTAGWTIYLDYFTARSFGKSMQETHQLITVNYGITYEECERVFLLLHNSLDISQLVKDIDSQSVTIAQDIVELTDAYNESVKVYSIKK